MNAEKESRGCLRWRAILRDNLLVILTLLGVGVGLLVGFTVAPTKPSASMLMWIGMPGELYMRTLRLIVIPLIVCSVITGASTMDPRSNGKVSFVTFLFVVVTNLLGCIIGAALCLIIEPGKGVESNTEILDRDIIETEDIFADLLRNVFPENMFASLFQQTLTKYEYKTVVKNNGTHDYTVSVQDISKKYLGTTNSTNVLGVFVVCALFGVTASSVGEKGRSVLDFFRCATDIFLKMMIIFTWATPIGLASLIAKTIAGTSNLEETFKKLGMFTFSCLVAQFIWGLLLMPIFYMVITRANPLKYLASIMPSILIVFSTLSTMVALPESFKSMENKNGVDRRISRFVVPLSAMIGRVGGAIHIASSCIFIIQIVRNDVSSMDVILVILLTWVSSFAVPPVSNAALITVFILLNALNIPKDSAAMLFAVEFLLDRVRSDVTMITQLTGVITVQRFCATSLPALEPDTEYGPNNTFTNSKTKNNPKNDGAEAVLKDGFQNSQFVWEDEIQISHL